MSYRHLLEPNAKSWIDMKVDSISVSSTSGNDFASINFSPDQVSNPGASNTVYRLSSDQNLYIGSNIITQTTPGTVSNSIAKYQNTDGLLVSSGILIDAINQLIMGGNNILQINVASGMQSSFTLSYSNILDGQTDQNNLALANSAIVCNNLFIILARILDLNLNDIINVGQISGNQMNSNSITCNILDGLSDINIISLANSALITSALDITLNRNLNMNTINSINNVNQISGTQSNFSTMLGDVLNGLLDTNIISIANSALTTSATTITSNRILNMNSNSITNVDQITSNQVNSGLLVANSLDGLTDINNITIANSGLSTTSSTITSNRILNMNDNNITTADIVEHNVLVARNYDTISYSAANILVSPTAIATGNQLISFQNFTGNLLTMTSASRFTVMVDGIYIINVSAVIDTTSMDQNAYSFLTILINGTTPWGGNKFTYNKVATNGIISSNFNLQLVTTDFIEFRLRTDLNGVGAGNLTNAVFRVVRIF